MDIDPEATVDELIEYANKRGVRTEMKAARNRVDLTMAPAEPLKGGRFVEPLRHTIVGDLEPGRISREIRRLLGDAETLGFFQ